MFKLLYTFVSCLLFSFAAFAGNNVFCTNQTNSGLDCTKISQIMYQGLLEGYSERVVQYQKEKGLKEDKDQAKLEAMELIPYEVFYESFKKCGENTKDMKSAQTCIISSLQSRVVKDTEEKS